MPRFAAIKYHHASFTPVFLLKATLEYGICFASFEAVENEVLSAIRQALDAGKTTGQSGDASGYRGGGEETEEESAITLPDDTLRLLGKARVVVEETDADDTTMEIASASLTSLVCRTATRLGTRRLQDTQSSSSATALPAVPTVESEVAAGQERAPCATGRRARANSASTPRRQG